MDGYPIHPNTVLGIGYGGGGPKILGIGSPNTPNTLRRNWMFWANPKISMNFEDDVNFQKNRIFPKNSVRNN